MFIVNPDPYLLPTFRISPFATSFLSENENLPFDNFADTYLDNKFNKKSWVYTINGRQAIEQALKNYNLAPTDVVTILTTSGNKYISSCVTSSIEKFCQWNRELSADTKIIFVNHEFGYPFQQMEELLALNIPIIEDCCTTFFSDDDNNKLGKYGDYAIYSLPKFFPIQVGGVLVANKNKPLPSMDLINDEQKQYIQKVLSFHLKQENNLLSKRKENFNYAFNKFSNLGFTLRFETKATTVPSVLMLNNNAVVKDLNALKVHFANYGVQSSVFYGEEAFFIPNHQSLSFANIDYLYNCLVQFLKNQ